MAVKGRLRFEILRRDNYTCRYCGAKAPDVRLTVDHVLPVSLGGTDDAANLVTACVSCNSGKASVTPDGPLIADVEADQLRWMRALQLAIEQRKAQFEQFSDDVEWFGERWNTWTYADSNGERHTVDQDDTWRQVVRGWLEAGIDIDELASFIPKAMQKKNLKHQERWRYFCGIGWSLVKDLHEAARRIAQEASVERGAPNTNDAPALCQACDQPFVPHYCDPCVQTRPSLLGLYVRPEDNTHIDVGWTPEYDDTDYYGSADDSAALPDVFRGP